MQSPCKREIFLAAIEHDSPESRRKFVAAACGTDSELLNQVESLLLAYDPHSLFMQKPATEVLHLVLNDEFEVPADTIVGSIIGRYELLEELAAGGMGSVYKARQLRPVERLVALKIIKAGMDTREVIARFEAERQALAMMRHPNIASVLDAGATQSGRPYFVMEFVDGCPITEFCDRHRMALRDRLRLLISVCEAVQHAHQKGIIHRDLKPGNVLIEIQDSKPIVKIIDFGIQKAIEQPPVARSLKTGRHQLLGTPTYMSPEQTGNSSQGIDTRSDVYSLGVLLYEVLTGQTPFDKDVLAQENLEQMCRIIREQEPPKPSIRVAIESPGQREILCADRRVENLRFSRMLKGELDWITMKALEKDPSRRYQSPSALAADLHNYLNNEAVVAGPPTAAYRLSRLVRKHRLTVTVALLVSISLLMGTIVSLWQASIARTAQQQATTYLAASEIEKTRFRKLAWESKIREAYSAWKSQRWADADKLLDELDKSDSDARLLPEWQMLRQEISRVLHRLSVLNDPIHEIRLIPGTSHVAAACGDGNVYIIDFERWKVVQKIASGVESLHALAISPDGTLLALGGSTDSETNLAYPLIFGLRTGELLHKLAGQDTTIESLQFSIDNKSLACGARYRPVQLIEIHGKDVTLLPAERRNLWLERSSDGQQIAAQLSSTSIWISEFQYPFSGREINLPVRTDRSVWVPETRWLVNAVRNETALQLYDTKSQTVLCSFAGPAGEIECLTVSDDASTLVAGLTNGEVVLWEFPESLKSTSGADSSSDETARLKSSALAHPAPLDDSGLEPVPVVTESERWLLSDSPITSVCITDTLVVLATYSGEMLAVQRSAAKPSFDPEGTLQEPNERFPTVATWSPDNTALLIGRQNGDIVQWSCEEWHSGNCCRAEVGNPISGGTPELKTISTASIPVMITAIAAARTPELYAWARHSIDVVVCDHGQERIITKLNTDRPASDDSDVVHAIEFSPDSQYVAWTGNSRRVSVINVSGGSDAIREFELPGHGNCLAWHPDGSRLFAGGSFNDIMEIVLASAQTRIAADTVSETLAIQVRGSGDYVISGHSDGAVRIHNLKTGVSHVRHIHQQQVHAITLSHDGRIGVSADKQGNIELWFAESGDSIGRLVSTSGSVIAGPFQSPQLTFSPDGRMFSVASFTSYPADRGPTIRSWNLKPALSE